MDAGKVFVLVITAVAFGILALLELKSRRSKRAIEDNSQTNPKP